MNAPEPIADAAAFSTQQKDYLQGFAAGLAAINAFPFAGVEAAGKLTADPESGASNLAAEPTWFGWPQDEITREEQLKRERNPLDIWDTLVAHARDNKPPEGGDIYRFKSFGLFWVAPAQQAFMVRVRVPANVLTGMQLRALADIAADIGGGYADVTTRGNIQIREIAPRSIIDLLTRLADAGLSTRGAGADNVRNITASPLADIDPAELIDTRPLAKAMQMCVANSRDLFGLPRKFNISFDGGGRVSVVTDTNDIGFVATRIDDTVDVVPGVHFRVLLAGITGHLRFAEDCGLLVAPDECVAVAAAMLRVFAEHGDRTDRSKARLCYLLDRIGAPKFLELVQQKLAFPLRFVPTGRCSSRTTGQARSSGRPRTGTGRPVVDRRRDPRRPDVRTADARLARVADEFGSGELRVTVWQNIIVPNVADDRVAAASAAIPALGFATSASSAVGGVVACTGNTGCRFSATDTKGHAIALARHLDAKVGLDAPINIHLTGCPHSCAQHYIADIGLLGAQVPAGSESVDGYHVYVGGGVEHERGLGRELAKNVPFDALPPLVERLLSAYTARRQPGESFNAFARRHDVAAMQDMAGAGIT